MLRDSKRYSSLKVEIGGMPPLRHWVDKVKSFSIQDSDVVRWLIGSPDRFALYV